jgi:hypothetical protein
MDAKKEYISLTGKLTEEDDEYEDRMSCFNNWYIFQRENNDAGDTLLDEILPSEQELDEKMKDALKSVEHSLYEFAKINFRKQIVLKDILHNKKLILDDEQKSIGLVVGDIFTGRVISIDEKHYLLKGVCTLPNGAKSNLKKQSKKVRKYNNEKEELAFLLQLESLKTKYLRYSHLEPSKIFILILRVH